ncbi:MAG: hypothetical protein LBQ88_12985 [Treponema sp.]|nr:hypothetical protein [Treponema sp.]
MRKASSLHISAVDEQLLNYGGILDLKVFPAKGDTDFQKLSIAGGHLFFGDDKKPVKADVHGNALYWNRTASGGAVESGYLRMFDGLTYGFGYVNYAGNKIHFEVAGENIYELTYQLDGEKTTASAGTMSLGYKEDPDTEVLMPYSIWTCQGAAVAKTDNASAGNNGIILGDCQTKLPVAFKPDVQVGKSGGEIYFGTPSFAMSINFKGTAFSPIRGVLSVLAFYDVLYQTIDGALFAVNSSLPDITAEPVITACGRFTGKLKPAAQSQLSELLRLSAVLRASNPGNALSEEEKNALQGDAPLSVAALLALPRPNMEDVHAESFNRMLSMAVYAANDKDQEVFKYLNRPVPVVSDDKTGQLTRAQARLAKDADISNFLVNKLALGYLSNSYAYANEPTIADAMNKANNAKHKISNFFSGTSKTSISRTSNYQKTSDAVYDSVYINNLAGIDAYTGSNSKEWGTRLYETVSNTAWVNGLITRMQTVQNQEELNHICTMLQILNNDNNVQLGDKTVTYAAAFHKRVVERTLANFVLNVNPADPNDKDAVDTLNTFLTDFLKVYFQNIQDGSFPGWTADQIAQAQQDLADAATAAGYETVAAYINNVSEIVFEASAAILAMKDPDIGTRLVNLFRDHPGLNAVIGLAFYASGVLAVVMGFKRKWSDLTSKEKAEEIAGCVSFALAGARDVAVWIAVKGFKGSFADIIEGDKILTENFSKLDFVEILSKDNAYSETMTKLGLDVTTDVAEAGSAEAAAIKWQKVFRITTVVGKVASVVFMAAAVGISIWQTYEDFKSGAGDAIEALDVISTVATGVAFFAEGAALCLSTVCAAIPVVGIAATLIGIILSIVELFIQRDTPPSPIEKFISDRCVPFVNGLEDYTPA